MNNALTTSARHALVFAASGALIAIACSGDAPYEPLKSDRTPHAAIVGGTVRDSGENRVAGAVVTLEPAQNGVSATAQWMLEHPDAAAESVPGRRVTVTSQSGRYAFGDVAGGEYILGVLADNHLGASRAVNVPASALTDTIIIDVDLTPTGDFSGNAFLEGATNHANTIVYVQGTSYVAVTNPAGGYTIHGVPVGSYTVRATHTGYLDETRSGTITTAGQVVTLSDMTLKIDLNIPPVANAAAPSQNCELDPVMLSGAASTDADGSIVSYAWDFDNDGSVDYASDSPSIGHAYAPGVHKAKLRVTDNNGASALAVVTFNVVQAETVFVASTGNDANPGTRLLPKLTIGAGMAVAVLDTIGPCPATVVVAGDHVESPSFLPDMRVLGGYNSVTWTRSPSSYSIVDVQTTPALAGNINTPTLISGFDFRAANSAGGASPEQRNSIAMRVVSSTTLTFDDCRFQSGNGFAGPNGVVGTAGGNGTAGTNGFGTSGGSGGPGGSPGGLAGGNGGVHAAAGIAGGGGCGTGGTAGMSSPCSGGGPGMGGNGVSGCQGVSGAGGPVQPNYGTGGLDWTPFDGFGGSSGTAGGGGGGGGGGGDYLFDGNPACQGTIPGSGGGGGGGGGGAATAGTGGGGGGASFAVYLYDARPIFFLNCAFTAANGGSGGAGGNGGAGGAGGAGGLHGSTVGEDGGNGGSGGAGGHGGGGSGGPGGLSYCVYKAGISDAVLIGSAYVTGSGGAGGAAGVRPDNVPAAVGINGNAGTVFP